jgi:tetratricopeptide (TPR) repeat protein
MHLSRFIAILFTAALLLPACKPTVNEAPTNVIITQPTEEAVAFTGQGWAAFEQKDYATALALFKQAIGKNDMYADAFNGMGWTYARMDSVAIALQYFDMAIGLNFSLIDAYAGRAFVSLALDKYNDAIASVSRVQRIGPPFYVFRHDNTVSLNDLFLVKAQSYFLLGEYTAAQTLINQLDPANHLDPTSKAYVEELANEIEVLWAQI